MLSAGLPMQFTNSANLLSSIQIFQCPFIHLVTSVGNFHSLRTVICPYVPHAMSTKHTSHLTEVGFIVSQHYHGERGC